MRTLSIDIETYSGADLSKCGVYKYAESTDFEILLFGYSVDGEKAKVIDLFSGETLPKEIIDALTDETIFKWAFNANFERVCLSRFLSDLNIPFGGKYLNPDSWRCSMVWAAYLGLPLSLENAGLVLGLEKQKLSEGKDLIRYFCKPCHPTDLNGGRTRNLPLHSNEKWQAFKEYNLRDVEAEMEIQQRLKDFPVPDFVWREYTLDQRINDRGVALDTTLVNNAIAADALSKGKLISLMKKITNLDNPNSVPQMKEWLLKNGLETDTLGKKAVSELIKDAPKPLADALILRKQLAKSSVKKYQAMENAVCKDSRARGMFQFYGANRTGRWAGRLIQLQNLPQNHLPDLDFARDLLRKGDFAALEMLYDSVPEVLSELIRTTFIPKPQRKFIVADFSAIEARVIAWLAGESWRNAVFASHGKIYEASASRMFRIPIENITKGSPLRQKGKIAELALGYGGSVGALKAMGALEMGLGEEELMPLVSSWRAANQNIVRLWREVDKAVITAAKERTSVSVRNLTFYVQKGVLFIVLPSKRKLCYIKPRVEINKYGAECVTYEGIGGTKKWERIESYGPKFVENIVQAISRDLLSSAMLRLSDYEIVMHIHDEIVLETDYTANAEKICETISVPPPWAQGLLLRADGYECAFYKKD